jgi:uncharacterized phage protein gp47/JayE
MTDYGVTPNGFVKKTYDTILSEMSEQAVTSFGGSIDLSPTSVFYQFLQTIALESAAEWETLEAMYYAAYTNTATGANLDAIVVQFGFVRLPATTATGSVTFSCAIAPIVNITIPAGTTISTVSGLSYTTDTAVTILTGQTSVSVTVTASQPGYLWNVSSNAIVAFSTPVAGVDYVTNPSPTTGGTNLESDAALRVRVANYAPGARGTLVAIQNAVMAVPGVTACFISEDTVGHTITATVNGGLAANILAALNATRPCGIAASLVLPVPQTIIVTVSVTRLPGYLQPTVLANIQTALSTYFSGLQIASSIIYSSVAAAVMQAQGVAAITALSITGDSQTISSFGSSIILLNSQVPVPGTHVITVQ